MAKNRNEVAMQRIPKPSIVADLTQKDRKFASHMLIYMIAIYVEGVIASGILANYMINIMYIGSYNWVTTAGIFTFPISFITASIIIEVWGYRVGRKVANFALILNACMAGLLVITMLMPTPTWFDSTAFTTALGQNARIFVAGTTAFYCSKLLDNYVFAKLKNKNNAGGYIVRALISSKAGHLIDGVLFSFIGFYGNMPLGSLLLMIPLGALLKILFEFICVPISHYGQKKLNAHEDKWAAEHGVSE